jgi:hypothetical protein
VKAGAGSCRRLEGDPVALAFEQVDCPARETLAMLAVVVVTAEVAINLPIG